MKCPECRTENRERAKFCMECGAGLTWLCPVCGTELPAEAKFCLGCEAQLGGHPTTTPTVAAQTFTQRLQRLVPRAFAERLARERGIERIVKTTSPPIPSQPP
jgi:hypothetical protein